MLALRHEPLFSHEPPTQQREESADGIRLVGQLTDVRHADSGSPDNPNLRGFLAS